MFRYVTIALISLAALLVVFNIIKALICGLKRSVGSLIAIVLSVAVSAVITSIICNPDSPFMVTAVEALKEYFGGETLGDLLSIEEMGEAVSHYAVMLIAPIFFTIVYIPISLVMSIIVAIIVKFVPPHKKPGLLLNRLGGAAVGLICGLLVSLVVLMPAVGTSSLVGSVDAALPEGEGIGELDESIGELDEVKRFDEVFQFIEDAAESKAVDVFLNIGCGTVYDLFASTDFEGERVYLRNEVDILVDVLIGTEALGTDMSEYGEEQTEALDSMIDGIESSPILKNAIAGIISAASEKWAAGEPFLGAEKPDAGELFGPVVDKLFEIMSTSDSTNISADLDTVKSIFNVMIKSGLLQKEIDMQTALEKLGKDGIIEELLVSVASNPRMAPLADEITKLSIRALADTIGIPESAGERYSELMADIATVLNESYGLDEADRKQLLVSGMGNVFDRYGVAVEGVALELVVDGILGDLGRNEYVEANDVEEFFAVYASAAAQSEGSAKVGGYSFELLSAENSYIPEITVNEDGTVSIGDRVLKNYNATTYSDSKAYNMGRAHENIGGAATLFSAETMVSSIVTVDDIMKFIGKYSDCEDIEAEAARVSAILSEVAAVFADIDMTEADTGELLNKLGSILDIMKDSEIFGSQTAKSILSALMQSDEIASSLGLSKSEITRFAEKMSEMADSDTSSGYAEATQAFVSTIDALTSVTDTDKTKEEKKQATETLINNITSESADMVSSMVTSSMVENLGVSAENTEAISSALTSMLGNMASFKEGEAGADASAVAKEAEAVNTILDLAMNIKGEQGGAPLFSNGEAEGAMGTTADEFIDMVVNSDVVSATIQDTVFENGYADNPFGVPELGEDEVAAVSDALQSYYENNGGGDELAKKLEAIAAIINVNFGSN